MTRINPERHARVFCDGYDISGYANSIGALALKFAATPNHAYSDAVMNVLAGRPTIGAGNISALADNDTAGLHVLANSGAGTRNIMVAFGVLAAPVAGNPVFAWKFEETGYQVSAGSGFLASTLEVGSASYAGILSYNTPWGVLLHASSAETAANTAVGLDDNGASSAKGGIFVYHIQSSDGTVTIKAQDAATNLDGSFADLSGATSGSVDASVTPKSGMIALSTSATVRRYIRWQLALGTATTVTFTSALIRSLF